MDLQLTNKKALVTGSTSGIGFAVAHSLLKEGAQVIINGRTEGSVNKAIARLKVLFPNAFVSGVAADFAHPKAAQTVIDQLPAVDILINNVGIYTAQSLDATTDEDWYKMFEVNLMSGMRLSRFYLPQMKAQHWGRIVFVSSECATLVPDDLIAYSVTKAAMLALSRGLAQLCKKTEVTVNTVLPGSTLSEGAQSFLAGVAAKENKTEQQVEAEFFESVRTSSLLARFANVDEIAATITYLCSPLSVATNGAAVKLDGGSMGGII